MSAARSTSSRWSTKKAMWCSRPRVPRQVARVGDVVRLLVRREPDARLGAVVEHDLLGQPQAEVLLEEDAVLAGVDGEEVDVVEVADADAAARVALRLVLQRRAKLGRRLVALGLVEELDAVAVGIEEAVGRGRGRGRRRATRPRRPPPRARRPGARAPRGCACGRRGGRRPPARDAVSFSDDALVVAEAAQVDRVAALAGDLHAEDLAEVVEALVGLRRQQLDVREVREVADGLASREVPVRVGVRGGSARRLGERHDRERRVDRERARDERAVADVEPLDVPATARPRRRPTAPGRCPSGTSPARAS